MRRSVTMALTLFCGWAAWAQGPSASPGSVAFTYQMNSPGTTTPATAKVTATLPASSSSLMMQATSDQGWLIVTPSTGHSPLVMTLSVNPTSLTPGSYTAKLTIALTTAPFTSTVVSVNLSISNPPSLISVKPAPGTLNYSPPAAGSSSPTLGFSYTTGNYTATGAPNVDPLSTELDVASTGDIIPFTVTVANSTAKGAGGGGTTPVWLRVSQLNGAPSLTTSGSAIPGSAVPVIVTLDPIAVQSLEPGFTYAGTVTISAANPANGSQVVLVNLVISAGGPTVTSIFPTSLIAPVAAGTAAVLDPVITINGDNFFAGSYVDLQVGTVTNRLPTPVLISRNIMQVTIKAAYLTPVPLPAPYPFVCTLRIFNPKPGTAPDQAPIPALLTITDPTLPLITSVVNAASYLPVSPFAGKGADPVPVPIPPAKADVVSPREIISIFGLNLAPAGLNATTPTVLGAYPTVAGVAPTRVWVDFLYTDPVTLLPVTVAAPIIITSTNQINAIVPHELSAVIGLAATVRVTFEGALPATFPVTVLKADPGIFTFGGLGQGQGAVINYDSTGATSINSSKAAAPRSSAISIFVTGMGDLGWDPGVAGGYCQPSAKTCVPVGALVPNGFVAVPATVTNLADPTYRVDIDGQPAVVTYAGPSSGSVVGLVQINAIVPPTVRTGAAIPLTVSIGDTNTARRSQANVTLAVK